MPDQIQAGRNRRVGVVGFGRMGVRVAQAAEQAGLTVAAVLDSAAEPWGLGQRPDLAPRLTADAEAFWRQAPDIVAIATTAPSHVPLLEEALRRGVRRVVVEKPFATSVVEARRAVALAEAAGARLLVNHSRRYCPNFAQLLRLDGSPELGGLRLITTVLGGGSLGCLGVHFFDMFDWMFGSMPEAVHAALTRPRAANVRGTGFDDPGATVTLFYPGGRRAFLDITDDLGIVGGVQFFFERGRVSFDVEMAPWRVVARRPDDRDKPLTQYGLPLEPVDLIDWHDFSMMDRWAALMADAAGDGAPVSGAALGLESIEIFAAARWSAATGRVVRLPLPPEAEAATYPIP